MRDRTTHVATEKVDGRAWIWWALGLLAMVAFLAGLYLVAGDARGLV